MDLEPNGHGGSQSERDTPNTYMWNLGRWCRTRLDAGVRNGCVWTIRRERRELETVALPCTRPMQPRQLVGGRIAQGFRLVPKMTQRGDGWKTGRLKKEV